MTVEPEARVGQHTGDRWAAGDAYEAYMGRWSRLMAAEFLAWLHAPPRRRWLEVGCGSGALTRSICSLADPDAVVACDQSEPFVAYMLDHVRDARVTGVVAATEALPERPPGFDVVVSGLVLNFIPDPAAALSAMRDRVRPGGVMAAYLWDYAGGIEMLAHFWDAAVAQDTGAISLDESRRFRAWDAAYVRLLFEAAGVRDVESVVLTVPTSFESFDDYWTPFLGGTGPAPTYVASLSATDRAELESRLRTRLGATRDGSIALKARAIAVRGTRS